MWEMIWNAVSVSQNIFSTSRIDVTIHTDVSKYGGAMYLVTAEDYTLNAITEIWIHISWFPFSLHSNTIHIPNTAYATSCWISGVDSIILSIHAVAN